MVLNPIATSSSETFPVPGAANKSNCPSAFVFTSFFGFCSLSVVEAISFVSVFSSFLIVNVLVKFTNKFLNSNSLKSAVTFSISGWSSSKSFA